jgi:two-component system NtrC family sensor kinase
MATAETGSRSSLAVPPPAARADALGILLDLALEATAATGVALLVPDRGGLRVRSARGPNAPARDATVALEGTVAGEAWYRSKLVSGAEPPPPGRQGALWADDRTVDVMAAPVLVAEQPAAVVVLYHRHLGHFRRNDAEILIRLTTVAAGLWARTGGPEIERPEPGPAPAAPEPVTGDRARGLLAAAADAIVVLDRSGRITSFNAAAERLWEVPGAEVVGQSWQQLPRSEPPEALGEAIQTALGGEAAQLELRITRLAGEVGWVRLSLSPLVEEGEVTAVLLIGHDVTDERRVQVERLQTEKMAAIGHLVSGMAHEINNPLASMLVNLELLLSEAREAAQRDLLAAVKSEAERAALVVRNLLTYLREQGVRRAPLDLRDAVRAAVALRRSRPSSQRIEVSADLPDQPVVVAGNQANLQQVFLNLLVNAEQAIQQVRANGRIWVRLTRSDTRATVTVDDDGPGIPPELLTRVFDPFYSTRPEGEGTGLGLSVSAGIVADHEGRIYALERPGGGARLVVELPLAQAGAARAPAPAEPGVEAVPASRGRVLVVDDEPDIRRSVAKFLARSGWAVDLADSGEEGLRLVAGGAYDVVLCDLRMPGIGGHEFYRRLQADHPGALERLIFMTGDVLSPEAQRFLQQARRPVLSKPFALRDLMEALGQVATA